MEAAPNRAEHQNRKIGDHETPLIHLTEGMRPSSTMFHVQEKNPSTGAYGEKKPMGIYATETPDHVHALLESMKDMHKGTGNMIHAEVHYNNDDIATHTALAAGEVAKSPHFSESAMPSGAGRQLAINAEATRRVPTKAGSSFKA
jgi:hypothetical protein